MDINFVEGQWHGNLRVPNMIHLKTNADRITAEQLRDGDWVIGDLGDQQVLLRYQDSLVKMAFQPVLVDTGLLELLGFGLINEQPEGGEVDVYQLQDFRVSVIKGREFVVEGGSSGRVPVPYLHQLQQSWRQMRDKELAADLLEQPHEIDKVKD